MLPSKKKLSREEISEQDELKKIEEYLKSLKSKWKEYTKTKFENYEIDSHQKKGFKHIRYSLDLSQEGISEFDDNYEKELIKTKVATKKEFRNIFKNIIRLYHDIHHLRYWIKLQNRIKKVQFNSDAAKIKKLRQKLFRVHKTENELIQDIEKDITRMKKRMKTFRIIDSEYARDIKLYGPKGQKLFSHRTSFLNDVESHIKQIEDEIGRIKEDLVSR